VLEASAGVGDRLRSQSGFCREYEKQRLVSEQKVQDSAEKLGVFGKLAQTCRVYAGQRQEASELLRSLREELKRVDRDRFSVVRWQNGLSLDHNCLSPTIGPKHDPIERIGGQRWRAERYPPRFANGHIRWLRPFWSWKITSST